MTDIDVNAAAAASYRAAVATRTQGPIDPEAVAEMLSPVVDPTNMPAVTAPEPEQLTYEQQARRAMADALVGGGHMTREQADQSVALEELIEQYPDEVITETPLERKDPLARINDLEPWADRPAHPQRYDLAPTLETMTTQDLAAVQDIFFDGRVPTSIAQTIWPEIEKLVTAPVSDADLVLLNASTMASARNRWGSDTDNMLGYGQRLVRELSTKHPKLLETLELTGAGSHPAVVFHIAEHAARLYRN
jgi:hypothetical protein